MFSREVFETFLGVIANTINFDVFFFEERKIFLQLDQLRPAVRSPYGRPVKNNNGFRGITVSVKINQFPVLVGKLKLWD